MHAQTITIATEIKQTWAIQVKC